MFFMMWRFQKRLEHYQNMKGPFYGGEYSRCRISYRMHRLSASLPDRLDGDLPCLEVNGADLRARAGPVQRDKWSLTDTLFFGYRLLQCLSRCPIVKRRSVAITRAFPFA